MSYDLIIMLPTMYSFTNQLNLIYMYKQDLLLNNLQGLIWDKIRLFLLTVTDGSNKLL